MSIKRIAFTGHRDHRTHESALEFICSMCGEDTVWVHGGAPGFDTQVDNFAADHHVKRECIRPDYNQYPPRIAPLIRNKQIVDGADLLVACYDGRNTGGTCYTVKYAREHNVPVLLVPCV